MLLQRLIAKVNWLGADIFFYASYVMFVVSECKSEILMQCCYILVCLT